jgi:hypothetical protein
MVAREAICDPDRAVGCLVHRVVVGPQQAQIDPCGGHSVEFPRNYIGRPFLGLTANGTWMPELFIPCLLTGPFPSGEGQNR